MSIVKSILSSRPSVNFVIHLSCWIIIFVTPLFFLEKGPDGYILWNKYIMHLSVPISFLITFYTNYFILIPSYLMPNDLSKTKKSVYFTGFNLYIIAMICLFIYYWESIFGFAGDPYIDDIYQHPDRHIVAHPIGFVIRNTLLCIVCIIISIFLRISANINVIKERIKEAEKAKTEAELQSIRTQLNPHFLLNTLNNIYALIQFDSDKAQNAVQELSKLLRYNLYDSQENFVPLRKEVDFINNYIELMRIRLNKNATIYEEFNIESESTIIAPQLFISLIENAFKHGISSEKESFINIVINESKKDNTITCTIENSYFPKDQSDKSGSGIGLELVRKRLDLVYKNNYTWEHFISDDGKKYVSKLTVNSSNHI